MPEINDKPSFNNDSLSSLVNKTERVLIKYINSGKNSNLTNQRKQEVFSALELMATRFGCPEGTVWDQRTGTCKGVK